MEYNINPGSNLFITFRSQSDYLQVSQ